MAFELVAFCEPAPQQGQPFAGTSQTIIDTYDEESEAIERGRELWKQAQQEASPDVMWWIVRVPGETLARWIADKGSEDEQILDLRTNELVRVV
ncbi:MAG: hypothetical protein GWP18_05135 [Proteobacteria bacterium]|nr:hypothetical protein [Pseudomonadota bacterium]